MNLILVGNNDGPLVLYQSLKEKGLEPVAIGLQKEPTGELRKAYMELPKDIVYFSGFDESRLLQNLQGIQIDLVINCFCNFKFIKLLEKYTVLNVHLSKLPAYRGRHPLHWALINGEKEIGVSIHEMTEMFDAGIIYWQKSMNIDEGLSVADVRFSLMELLANDFGNFIQDYKKGTLRIKKNKKEEASYISRRFPRDSKLTEWENRDLIYRKVMALRSETNPAFLQIGNDEILVLSAEKVTSQSTTPGTIIRVLVDGLEIAGKLGNNIILRYFKPTSYNFKENQQLL